MRCPTCKEAWSKCPGHVGTVTVISPGFEAEHAAREAAKRGE